MLLTETEIQKGLDSQFASLEPMLTGFRLKSPGVEADAISDLADDLQEDLSDDFVALISAYDFGRFTVGPVVFCNTGSYADELREYNLKPDPSWWGHGRRPPGRLMIANSDPYAFLLDCSSGAVLTFQHGAEVSTAFQVASDFRSFLRGVGTVFLLRQHDIEPQDLSEQVARDVGADERGYGFWRELAA